MSQSFLLTTTLANCNAEKKQKQTVNVDVILDDKNGAPIGGGRSAAGQQTSGVKQTTPANVDTVNRNDSISRTNRSLSK